MKMPSNRSLAQIGLGVTMALVLAMAWMLYSATYSDFESSSRLNRTHETLRAVDSTDFNFARAESVHRLFLLTGNESFLAERDRYLANAQKFAGLLIELSADKVTSIAFVFGRKDCPFPDRVLKNDYLTHTFSEHR